MKKNVISVLLLFLLGAPASSLSYQSQSQSVDDIIGQIQESLQNNDFQNYLELCSEELKQAEQAVLSSMVNDLGLDSISVFKVFSRKEAENRAQIVLRVLFENSVNVLIQTWTLSAVLEKEQWRLVGKNATGENRELYKINIPSDRVEKVDFFEIDHLDIKIEFRDALVFYDNVPHFETAMIVIGKGKLWYTPSVERERHLLNMVYRKKTLDNGLKYLYLRFSNQFFKEHVNIIRSSNTNRPISESDRKKAYSILRDTIPDLSRSKIH